jgi:hypothetical protein
MLVIGIFCRYNNKTQKNCDYFDKFIVLKTKFAKFEKNIIIHQFITIVCFLTAKFNNN